jgi:hypothetical protein
VPPLVELLRVVVLAPHIVCVPVIFCGDCDRLPKFVPPLPVVRPVIVPVIAEAYTFPLEEKEPLEAEVVALTCKPVMVKSSVLFF